MVGLTGDLNTTAVSDALVTSCNEQPFPKSWLSASAEQSSRQLELKEKLLSPCSAKEMGGDYGSQPNNFLRDHPDQGWPKFKIHGIISEQVVTVI